MYATTMSSAEEQAALRGQCTVFLTGGVVEEAAQAGLNSLGLGGPVEIPPDLRAAALQRAMAFDSQGTVHA